MENPNPEPGGVKNRVTAWWRAGSAKTHRYAAHSDPLAETGNWVALTIGSHLPFWPLYVLWSAGVQAFPTALLTIAPTPVFLAIPMLSRRSGLASRIAMSAAGVANTVWTVWILGSESGSSLFLMPCAALAALLFRKSERGWMVALTLLPLAVWFVLRDHAPTPLHQYDPESQRQLFTLNAVSVGVLICLFGWFQTDIYRKMEHD